MEQALLEAHRADKLKLPLLQADFSKDFPDIDTITTLDAPHRIADAIFAQSRLNGTRFRDSKMGLAFEAANVRNATALFQYCPHALVFGVWDSTGSAGGLGNKIQRAVDSEITGINAQKGIRTSSRLDPALRSNPELYKSKDGTWTSNPDNAERGKDGNPTKYEKKLSNLNLGNVTPDFVRYDPQDKRPLRTMYEEIRVGDVLPGGVTIDYAVQTTVVSLSALRRLRFPVDQKETADRNNAARTLLAALALAAITHFRDQGYDLRSRCLLIPEGDAPFELMANDGKVENFLLTTDGADNLFNEALDQAKASGLPWEEKTITLIPEQRLIEAVRKSREAKGSGE
jgi:CRISPR-associated protein Csb1